MIVFTLIEQYFYKISIDKFYIESMLQNRKA